jgi:HD domain
MGLVTAQTFMRWDEDGSKRDDTAGEDFTPRRRESAGHSRKRTRPQREPDWHDEFELDEELSTEDFEEEVLDQAPCVSADHSREARTRGREKFRRQIVVESARLMYRRHEKEYYRAKLKAARAVCGGWVKPSDLPSNAEIRDEIQRMASLFEGEGRHERLRDMRMEALRLMRLLREFKPKLIGSTLTGHVRHGSDIDLHVFTSSIDSVAVTLEQEGIVYDIEHKRVTKQGEERVYTHIHIQDRFPIELTVYSTDKIAYAFKSSITGKAIERATLAEFEQFLLTEYPDVELDDEVLEAEAKLDRFQVFRSLLLPLEKVGQSKKHHPEGDVLYHSLQVFELARYELPYDEEFLLAALLHDVGKGIDPDDHVAAGLEALEGAITPRTAWFIEHHMHAHQVADGTIGFRAAKRLRESLDFEELMLLQKCDREGRQRGMPVMEVDEALDFLRELSRLNG